MDIQRCHQYQHRSGNFCSKVGNAHLPAQCGCQLHIIIRPATKYILHQLPEPPHTTFGRASVWYRKKSLCGQSPTNQQMALCRRPDTRFGQRLGIKLWGRSPTDQQYEFSDHTRHQWSATCWCHKSCWLWRTYPWHICRLQQADNTVFQRRDFAWCRAISYS